MAIDPGLRSVGIYINIQDGDDMALTIKALKNDTEKDIYNNIDIILRELIKFYKIKVILCEDYAMSKFGKSTSGSCLAEIKGLLKSIIYDDSLGVDGMVLIPISMWKSIHKNLGLPKYKGKKYIEIINKTFKKNLKTADEADAYLMLISAYLINKGVVKSNSQLRLLNKLREYGEIWEKKVKIIYQE